jgi:methionyl-tRNA formyltransferase
LKADLSVACDYGQILSAATLSATRCGGINLHAALLPKYRGAAPINWAIYHGETETGVTVIHMTPQLDAGPCIARSRTNIGPDETAGELEIRLAELGAPLTREAIELIESDRAAALPQDSTQASRAPRLKKSDGLIDWTRPAAAIKNHIRAMEPWPKTYTHWLRSQGAPMRLILGPASIVQFDTAGTAPGTIIEASGNRLVIAAGQDAVLLKSIQPAGKRVLAIDEFLRGHPLRPGDIFGPAADD